MNRIERTAEARDAGKQTTRSMKGLDVIHPDAAHVRQPNGYSF